MGNYPWSMLGGDGASCLNPVSVGSANKASLQHNQSINIDQDKYP